jgi:2-keto-4-pentenoate hydratase
MVVMNGQTTAAASDRLARAPEPSGTRALTRREHRRLAEVLLRAANDRAPIEPLSVRYPELTIDDAATIRDTAIADRVAHGERVIGAKVALPTRLGWLTSGMVHAGAVLDLADLIDPHVEPKLVLILAAPLQEPVGGLTELLAIADRVSACLEVVDSRFHSYDLIATDAIADNCGAARLIIGADGRPPARTELATGAGALQIESPGLGPDRAALAPSSASLEALVWLANAAVGERGELQAGALLVSPSLTARAPLSPGARVCAELEGAGRVELVTS